MNFGKIILVIASISLVPFYAVAQSITPLEELLSPPRTQEELVIELRALENKIEEAKTDDKKLERERLYSILKETTSEAGGRFVADALWINWISSAPKKELEEQIKAAMERRRWYDYEGARIILNKVVEEAPNYFEGWNQRAYILFLQNKFDASLKDIDKALALEPRHFAALSGKARILFHQGKHEEARSVLLKAVDVHPWIYERFLLAQPPKSGQEPREGKDAREL